MIMVQILHNKFEIFGLSSLVCKVNGIPLYNLSFDKSYRTAYELTVQSLDRDLCLFENSIFDEIFAKIHGIIILDMSGTQDMSIVRTDIIHLECTFAEPLEEIIA